MSETEREFKTKIKQEIKSKMPMWLSGLINVEDIIEDNAEVLIEWIRRNKNLMQRLINQK